MTLVFLQVYSFLQLGYMKRDLFCFVKVFSSLPLIKSICNSIVSPFDFQTGSTDPVEGDIWSILK